MQITQNLLNAIFFNSPPSSAQPTQLQPAVNSGQSISQFFEQHPFNRKTQFKVQVRTSMEIPGLIETLLKTQTVRTALVSVYNCKVADLKVNLEAHCHMPRAEQVLYVNKKQRQLQDSEIVWDFVKHFNDTDFIFCNQVSNLSMV